MLPDDLYLLSLQAERVRLAIIKIASVKHNKITLSLTQKQYTQDGTIAASQHLPLRQEFVYSLCIAEQLGVLKSIEHIAKSLHESRQPESSLLSLATVEESLEAVSLTGSTCNSLEEEGQKLKDSEPMKMTEDDKSRKDTVCKDTSFTSGPKEKLKSSDFKSETVDSKIKSKAAATDIVTDSGSKKFRYHGAGEGSFLT